jgi:soluble lytic murein transglycosylase-like protein
VSMRAAMLSLSGRVGAVCLCTGGVLALPVAAHADVMQIGDAGASWIAGGPETADTQNLLGAADADVNGGVLVAADPDAPVLSDEALALMRDRIDADLQPASVTQVLDAAGPTRWRAHIAAIARKYDISPTLLEAVIWQESRWNELAISPVGARGLAQLMPGTAREMGVNALDPMANIEGGARYLRLQLDRFGGNIEKALAAYNAGPGRVERAGGIPKIRETQAYVAAIMARLTDPVRQ